MSGSQNAPTNWGASERYENKWRVGSWHGGKDGERPVYVSTTGYPFFVARSPKEKGVPHVIVCDGIQYVEDANKIAALLNAADGFY